MEQRELRRSLQPQSVAQLMRLLNDTRRNNRIYVRLLTGTPGAVVKGEAMTALPPSVLSVHGKRPQRRQLLPDPQRHGRRMGAGDGLGHHGLPPPDNRRRWPVGGLSRWLSANVHSHADVVH